MTPSDSDKPNASGAAAAPKKKWQKKNRQKNFIVRKKKKCAQLFIVFSGTAGLMGFKNTGFLSRTGLLTRNIILLRDPKNSFYHKKIMPGAANFSELVGWLEEQITAMPHVREVYCVGNSMGAFSAILAGSMMKAKAVYAIAPMANLHETFRAKRSKILTKLELPEEQLNLNVALAKHNGVTEYTVYFSKNYERDRLRAKELAAHPHVKRIAVKCRDHNTFAAMGKYEMYETMLPPYLASKDA